LNDDRVGRTRDRLFDADRASLVTETVQKAVEEYGIELEELHNDSTTVTVTGAYDHADGYTRGGRPTPAFRHGHNKDFRPDLKQLLYILRPPGRRSSADLPPESVPPLPRERARG